MSELPLCHLRRGAEDSDVLPLGEHDALDVLLALLVDLVLEDLRLITKVVRGVCTDSFPCTFQRTPGIYLRNSMWRW